MGLNQQKLLSDYIKKSRFWEANSDVQIRYLQTVTLKKKNPPAICSKISKLHCGGNGNQNLTGPIRSLLGRKRREQLAGV